MVQSFLCGVSACYVCAVFLLAVFFTGITEEPVVFLAACRAWSESAFRCAVMLAEAFVTYLESSYFVDAVLYC